MRVKCGPLLAGLAASVFLSSCGGGGGGGGVGPPIGGSTPQPTAPPPVRHVGDVVAQVYTGSDSSDLAYDPDDKVLVVASGSQAFIASTGLPAFGLPSGTGIQALAYDQPRRTFYAAGNGTIYRAALNGSPTSVASGFGVIEGLAVDPSGTIYVVDDDHISTVTNGTVRRLTAPGTVTNPNSTSNARPHAAFDTRDGALYVTDTVNHQIKRVTVSGNVTTIAGSCAVYSVGGPTTCWPGDAEGTGNGARFGDVGGIAYDPDDDVLLVADATNNQLWAVTANGTATIAAGYGPAGILDGNGRTAFLLDPLHVTYATDSRLGYFGQFVGGFQDRYRIGNYALGGLPTTRGPLPVQTFTTPTYISQPQDLAPSPDGSAWFVEGFGGAIGHVTDTGGVVERKLVRNWGSPWKIAVDASGTPWVTAQQFQFIPIGPGVLRLNADGTQTDIVVPPSGAGQLPGPTEVDSIAIGFDGNPWYGEYDINGTSLGFIDRTNLSITHYTTAAAFNPPKPRALLAGPDGNLWFATDTRATSNPPTPGIGRMTPGGALVPGIIATKAQPFAFARNALDGAVWYVDANNVVGRISSSATETTTTLCTSIPGCFTAPVSIAAAPDGTMWMSEQNFGDVARISPNGTITRYLLPHAHPGVGGIAVRSDGKVWVAGLAGAGYLLDPAAYDAAHFPYLTTSAALRQPAGRSATTLPRRSRW
jgi:streptogramin lyase